MGDTVHHAAAGFGETIIVPDVGNFALPYIEIGIAASGGEVDLPGDLIDRHIHPVGDKTKPLVVATLQRELKRIGAGVVYRLTWGTNRLFAGVQSHCGAGFGGDANKIEGVDQIVGHQEHLSAGGFFVIILKMKPLFTIALHCRGSVFGDIHGMGLFRQP